MTLTNAFVVAVATLTLAALIWKPVLGVECHQGWNEWENLDAWKASGGSWDIKKTDIVTGPTCTTKEVDRLDRKPICYGIFIILAKPKDKMVMYRGCEDKSEAFIGRSARLSDPSPNDNTCWVTRGGAATEYKDSNSKDMMVHCNTNVNMAKTGKKISKSCLDTFEQIQSTPPLMMILGVAFLGTSSFSSLVVSTLTFVALLWRPVLGLECTQGTNEWESLAKWKEAGGTWDIKDPFGTETCPGESDKHGPYCVAMVFFMGGIKDKFFLYRGCTQGSGDYRNQLANKNKGRGISVSVGAGGSGHRSGKGEICYIFVDAGDAGIVCFPPFDMPKTGKVVHEQRKTEMEKELRSYIFQDGGAGTGNRDRWVQCYSGGFTTHGQGGLTLIMVIIGGLVDLLRYFNMD